MSASHKSEIEMHVIQRVKAFRERAKLSQSELATLLGVSNGFIGQAESSNYPTKYNLNHLNQMAIIFKCSVKDFMPDEPFQTKASNSGN